MLVVVLWGCVRTGAAPALLCVWGSLCPMSFALHPYNNSPSFWSQASTPHACTTCRMSAPLLLFV